MIVDTVAMLSEGGRQLRNRYVFQPMMQPGEMKQAFVDQGLRNVADDQLMYAWTTETSTTCGHPSLLVKGHLASLLANSKRGNSIN